jgi:hypothetical protein
MGQAIGTAAAIAIRDGISLSEVAGRMKELQQQLLRDDAYLPWVTQEFSVLTRDARLAASQGDPEPVRDGINRPVGDDIHGWVCRAGDWIEYRFDEETEVATATVIVDSALDRRVSMSFHQKDDQLTSPPEVMPRVFRVDCLEGDRWREAVKVEDNHRRLCRLRIGRACKGIRFTLEETWGAEESRLYAFCIEQAK